MLLSARAPAPIGGLLIVLIARCGDSVAPEHADSGSARVDGAELSSDADPGGEAAMPGDVRDATSESAPSEMEVLPAAFVIEDAPLRMLSDGDRIDLWRAPQGGHVVLVAAKVRHFPSSAAALRVRVWNPASGILIAEEKRTVAMVPVPDEPDTAQPDLRSRSQVSHVPLCPNYDADPIVDHALDVEVQITALYTDPPAQAAARLRVLPACSQESPAEQELCRCECGASYTLGKCKPDAATVPADAASARLGDTGAP